MRTIVFVARGCPAGALGVYGNEWVVTPNLDRLAAESVVFDRHISDRPEPASASTAWLGENLGVLKALAAVPVHTILLRANHPETDGPDWFYAGWGEVFDARPQEEDKSPLDALSRALPALLDRLAAVPDFLLWIELDRLLPPWEIPQAVFDAYLQESYDEEDESDAEGEEAAEELEGDEDEDEDAEEDAEADADIEEIEAGTAVADEEAEGNEETEPAPDAPVIPPWYDPPTGLFDATDADAWKWLHTSFASVLTTLDAELGVAFDLLRGRGLDRSAAWLFTSDFGYPLGEHGQVGLHRPWLHEELVHLPLMLRLPGASEAGRRVSGFTQPPDLAATLLELFGVKPTAPSLLPVARGEVESHRKCAVTALELNGASEAALRTSEWAFLLPGAVPEGEVREPRLFEKPDDRWEVNDLRSRYVERAEELEAELKAKRGE